MKLIRRSSCVYNFEPCAGEPVDLLDLEMTGPLVENFEGIIERTILTVPG